MSRIDYTWLATKPPKPDIYTTRRNESKYLTQRYWDGSSWYEIAHGNSRGGKPFTWPKGSRIKKPVSKWGPIDFYIRKISAHVGSIQWGTPYRVYDDKEVLAYLVKVGRLPINWRETFQGEMQAADHREIRE